MPCGRPAASATVTSHPALRFRCGAWSPRSERAVSAQEAAADATRRSPRGRRRPGGRRRSLFAPTWATESGKPAPARQGRQAPLRMKKRSTNNPNTLIEWVRGQTNVQLAHLSRTKPWSSKRTGACRTAETTMETRCHKFSSGLEEPESETTSRRARRPSPRPESAHWPHSKATN